MLKIIKKNPEESRKTLENPDESWRSPAGFWRIRDLLYCIDWKGPLSIIHLNFSLLWNVNKKVAHSNWSFPSEGSQRIPKNPLLSPFGKDWYPHDPRMEAIRLKKIPKWLSMKKNPSKSWKILETINRWRSTANGHSVNLKESFRSPSKILTRSVVHSARI